MNLPNRLTVLRMLLVPAVCLCIAIPGDIKYVSCALFVIAALTDFADGRIARGKGLVTDFGKFLDPIADKLLVICPMIILIGYGRMPAWMAAVTCARELTVSGFRLVAALKGRVIAADRLGKYKTTAQMLAVPAMLLFGTGKLCIVPLVLNWISVMLCTVSGIMYIYNNRDIISDL